jgi:hypothetical protein
MKTEIWRVYQVPLAAPNSTGDHSHDLILAGFNPSTKKKLHEYGPFESEDEVTSFCREHTIPLPAGFRFE